MSVSETCLHAYVISFSYGWWERENIFLLVTLLTESLLLALTFSIDSDLNESELVEFEDLRLKFGVTIPEIKFLTP